MLASVVCSSPPLLSRATHGVHPTRALLRSQLFRRGANGRRLPHPAFSTSSRRLTLAAENVPSRSPAPPPPLAPSAASPVSDPKISRIVDEISTLTLLQAADLVSLLKVRFPSLPHASYYVSSLERSSSSHRSLFSAPNQTQNAYSRDSTSRKSQCQRLLLPFPFPPPQPRKHR